MENQSSADRWRLAEYTAMRNEMQSITVARYAVLAFTFTAIAAITAAIYGFGQDWEPRKAALIVPITIAAILLPSLVVNLGLSRQYHRLTAFITVFFEPMLIQQRSFEKYNEKRPGFWGYVKPLAFAYTLLVGLTVLLFLITFWSCFMLVAMLLLIGAHLYPLVKLWDSGASGTIREQEMRLWGEIKDEIGKSQGK